MPAKDYNYLMQINFRGKQRVTTALHIIQGSNSWENKELENVYINRYMYAYFCKYEKLINGTASI